MSTGTTTHNPNTGQHTTPRGRHHETQQPTAQTERSAANRLRTTFVPVRLAFTWLGVRRTLAPEQRTTAARELSSQYDQMKSEAQRRLGTLYSPADYPGTLDGMFDMEWTVVPIEPQTLRDSNRLRQMVARDFDEIQAAVGEMLVDRPRRNIPWRGGVAGAA